MQLPLSRPQLAPLVAVTVLVVAWAVDTSTRSGEVLRNVELAGVPIDGSGGDSGDTLPAAVASAAAQTAARAVTITSGDRTYETTAGELGLAVDEEATVDAALDTGRGGLLLVQPLTWLGSFLTTRQAPIALTVDEARAAATLHQLQGTDLVAPVEPRIEAAADGFAVVPGEAGAGIDVGRLADDLRARAEAEPEGSIALDADVREVAPTFTDRQAQDLVDRADAITGDGLTLEAGGTRTTVPAATLRGWLGQTVTDGRLDLAFDEAAATAAVPGLLGDVAAEPTDAGVTLRDGRPVVVPARDGVTCCGEGSGALVWEALRAGEDEVALEVDVRSPALTTEEVTGWGITEAIGGHRGYRDAAEVPDGPAPGFTTYHAANEARNVNIERIADEVRGAVIPPGGTFSVNDHVGRRTYEDGYVDAGAIRDGRHVEEVGGGISQFATTLFNAAYFAGLDILESQSHSEWMKRYPPGREATMGFPHPDLVLRNDTPYGVLVWTSYTATSVTVTMYSTPHVEAAQTAVSESTSGACRVVVTTRTRTYLDGRTEEDRFRSTYRPGDGLTC